MLSLINDQQLNFNIHKLIIRWKKHEIKLITIWNAAIWPTYEFIFFTLTLNSAYDSNFLQFLYETYNILAHVEMLHYLLNNEMFSWLSNLTNVSK